MKMKFMELMELLEQVEQANRRLRDEVIRTYPKGTEIRARLGKNWVVGTVVGYETGRHGILACLLIITNRRTGKRRKANPLYYRHDVQIIPRPARGEG